MKKAASHKTTIPSASSMTLTPSPILFELLLLSPMFVILKSNACNLQAYAAAVQ